MMPGRLTLIIIWYLAYGYSWCYWVTNYLPMTSSGPTATAPRPRRPPSSSLPFPSKVCLPNIILYVILGVSLELNSKNPTSLTLICSDE